MTDDELRVVWDAAWDACPKKATTHQREGAALQAVADAAVAEFATRVMAE